MPHQFRRKLQEQSVSRKEGLYSVLHNYLNVAAMSLSLKVTYGDDIRRFSVSSEITFSELHSFVEKHLGVSNLVFRYVDDEEELVTIGSNIELAEAKRLQPSVLRLTVNDGPSSQKLVVPEEENKTELLRAAFVRDVSIADGSQVTINTPFRKVWKLRNDGKIDWPENVKLCLVGPDNYQLGGSLAGISVRPVKVGEEIDIAIDLRAPPTEGRYLGYWKLMSDNEPFGPRIWVDVSVVASRAEEEEKKRKVEIELRRALEEEAKRLEEEAILKEEEERRYQQMAREEEERQAALLKELAEEEHRKEEEERRRQEEEEEMRRLEEEAFRVEEERKRLEEEALRIEEERKRQEEEMRRIEEERKRQEEEERQRREVEARIAREAEEKRKAEEAELAKFPFADQYKQIAAMGFEGKQVRELLTKHKGNVEAVVDSLLAA